MAGFGLSWNDARAYATWLSEETGRAYRLPSEAEWEYAARGGTDAAYWWGAAYDAARAQPGEPRDVSLLVENPFGLRGMLGNVREWVEDCYVNTYAEAPTDGSAVTIGDCGRRVVRGGDWSGAASDFRAANRARISVDVRDRTVGFRIATSDLAER